MWYGGVGAGDIIKHKSPAFSVHSVRKRATGRKQTKASNKRWMCQWCRAGVTQGLSLCTVLNSVCLSCSMLGCFQSSACTRRRKMCCRVSSTVNIALDFCNYVTCHLNLLFWRKYSDGLLYKQFNVQITSVFIGRLEINEEGKTKLPSECSCYDLPKCLGHCKLPSNTDNRRWKSGSQ